MRKFLKNSILEIFQTMYEAHISIKKMIDKKDFENVSVLLEDCQNTAVQIGTSIESSEGEGFVTVGYLEEYCEAVYEVATSISDEYSGNKAQKTLDKKLIEAENSVKNDVKVRLEIVFCPYKASMWDSLESVWKAANEDPDCNAYVVPIPYYDRNPDHSFGEFHYEGGDYPDYVPITHYEAYNFEARRPDVVYIHNPYDEYNNVTSVDPRFYSHELKKYTECLVYIPYFVLGDFLYNSFFINSATINSDRVIAQSEKSKTACIKYYTGIVKDRAVLQQLKEKILPLGSPKVDRIASFSHSASHLPEEWTEIIKNKTVVLYNTGISGLLNNNEAELIKLKSIIGFFRTRNDLVLWWRPHPLFKATIHSMRSDLMEEYQRIIEEFECEKIGIFDESPDFYNALCFSDIYFGDDSSLVHLYGVTGKPIVLQNIRINDYSENKRKIAVDTCCGCVVNNKLYSCAHDANRLYCLDIDKGAINSLEAVPCDYPYLIDPYKKMLRINDNLWMIPNYAKDIAIINTSDNSVRKVNLPEENRTKSSKFFEAFEYDGKIYMFPALADRILIYDIASNQFESDGSSIKKIIDSNWFLGPFIFVGKGCRKDHFVYLPIYKTNAIMEYDMIKRTSALFRVTENSHSVNGIEYDGKQFWIVTDNNIIIWDKASSKVTEYSEKPSDYVYDYYNNILFANNSIWVSSHLGNAVLRIDINSGKSHMVNQKDQPYFISTMVPDDNKVIIQSITHKNYSEYVICDPEGNTINTIAADIEVGDDIHIIDESIIAERNESSCRLTKDYIICETQYRTLKNIADVLFKKDLVSNNQKQVYSSIFANADGYCGKRIHDEIVKSVYES